MKDLVQKNKYWTIMKNFSIAFVRIASRATTFKISRTYSQNYRRKKFKKVYHCKHKSCERSCKYWKKAKSKSISVSRMFYKKKRSNSLNTIGSPRIARESRNAFVIKRKNSFERRR